MSEQILQAIIQLFAISANVDGVTDSERQIIRKFLLKQLNDEDIDQYIELFDVYTRSEVANTLQPFKAFIKINEGLTQEQKIVVFLYLLELIMADGMMSQAEAQLADTVADAFHIAAEEYQLIKDFSTQNNLQNLNTAYTAIISNEQELNYPSETKHIYRENLWGIIRVLRIPSIELYVIHYNMAKYNLYLNGVLVRDDQIYIFSPGSTLRNDKMLPIYYSDIVGAFLDRSQIARITFEAKNIFHKFVNKKVALRDINIAEESGRLIGIMGASGSGKSTLLNILNGNDKPTKGRVLINNIDIYKEKKSTRGIIGYVPQDDLLIEELTVYQNMYYAAQLCLGNYSEQQLDEVVITTLSSLGLAEIKDLKVGSTLQKTISGGQRKRLNIGLELLREPAILFVDEPTSGLSSQDSENILDLLKELTLRGKLVFVVIHQPSSDIFKMFDKLIILDMGGYPIYYGPPIEAVTYFKTIANFVNSDKGMCSECGDVNVEQIFSIIETKVINEYGRFTAQRKTSPKKWHDYFKERIPTTHIKTSYEKPKIALKVPSKFVQWEIFITRDVLAKLSNTQYLIINLLVAPLLGFILAYIVKYVPIEKDSFYNLSNNMNLPAYIFMSIIVALFIGLTVSAEEIIKDAKMLKREAFLNLSRNSYLLSKISILFTFSAIQTLTFILIGNWLLEINGMTFTYGLVLFSTACFANVLGLNISDTFNSAVTIYIIIPLLLIPQLILGGVVIRFDEMHSNITSAQKVPLIGEFMTSRWAFEAIAVRQFKENAFETTLYPLEQKMAVADYKQNYYLPTLGSKLDFCFQNLESTEREVRHQVKENFRLLQKEIRKEQNNQLSTKQTFKYFNNLTLHRFNYAVYDSTKKYLTLWKDTYSQMQNDAIIQKDEVVRQMSMGNADVFLQKKQKYYNERLAEMVKNTRTPERIVEVEGELVPKIYPIFFDPDHALHFFDFRTHFFAPHKYFAGNLWDTFYFNILFIWGMIAILYVFLYYSIGREVLNLSTFLQEMYKTVRKKVKK